MPTSSLVGWVAKLLPADLGGQLLAGLVALMKALSGAARFVGSLMPPTFGPRTEATIRIVVETLVLLGEVKLVRWTYNICWVLSWPFRRKAPAQTERARPSNLTVVSNISGRPRAVRG